MSKKNNSKVEETSDQCPWCDQHIKMIPNEDNPNKGICSNPDCGQQRHKFVADIPLSDRDLKVLEITRG
ncbi:hypothetical protein HOE31_01785 [bacterium]|jgi:hypothetical protein|nr:hypothetical protein [bacterium]MBT4121661.1 hypothetical protein [bacterium]MBT4335236.1 hypothetical protein [bacterium]MBT4495668.1 hypothetical protein [bacterium]MBT4763810.1 hypothetical protein [bacterium]